ncbi:hypothetical protein ABTX81_39340 [Kitasatospora sp. NPDC097605]|uniref:hypothetical protein n=1 Tax=Kitasatospora sp. NPDC097605 TaxID=3157226 RepID=UPI00332951A9
MIEILDNLDVLTRQRVDLATVTVGGVALGAPGEAVRHREIVEAHSAVVARYRGGSGVVGEYYDADGRQLTLDEVVGHVVRSDGSLHCADGVGYSIRGGVVDSFGIGDSYLSHFARLTSYDAFLEAFGTPDRVTEDVAFGDLLNRYAYYQGGQKRILWDAFNDRVSWISLGSLGS